MGQLTSSQRSFVKTVLQMITLGLATYPHTVQYGNRIFFLGRNGNRNWPVDFSVLWIFWDITKTHTVTSLNYCVFLWCIAFPGTTSSTVVILNHGVMSSWSIIALKIQHRCLGSLNYNALTKIVVPMMFCIGLSCHILENINRIETWYINSVLTSYFYSHSQNTTGEITVKWWRY